jgi:hypothetical protein
MPAMMLIAQIVTVSSAIAFACGEREATVLVAGPVICSYVLTFNRYTTASAASICSVAA